MTSHGTTTYHKGVTYYLQSAKLLVIMYISFGVFLLSITRFLHLSFRLPDSERDSKGTSSRRDRHQLPHQPRHGGHLYQPELLPADAAREHTMTGLLFIPSVSLSVHLLSISVHLSIYLSIYLSVCLYVCLYVCLSVSVSL